MRRAVIFFLGVVLWPFFKGLKIKKDVWIFGSGEGNSYSDNSKYLFQHVVQHKPGVKAVWITSSKNVIQQLDKQGISVYGNLSLRGLWYVMVAEVVFFCTSRNDIHYVFKKKSRKIVNLWHGMPIKKIAYDYLPHRPENRNRNALLWDTFVAGFQHKEVDVVLATSSFYRKILESSFRNPNIYVTGQPRTDAFFQWDRKTMKEKFGFGSDKKIITYMPTHRAYGKGKFNPSIFGKNKDAHILFEKHNINLAWKFHKNMVSSVRKDDTLNASIVDLSARGVDPQELLFITDILITDYSSCYIDFLFLDRPIIFYHYDNYEEDDNELYFSIAKNNPGRIARTEKDLLDEIREILNGKDSFVHRRQSYKELYHSYTDGLSCSRVVELFNT